MIALRLRGGETALIDDEDAALAEHAWSIVARGYVGRSVGKAKLYLHREVLALVPGDGREGDHRDGNKVDCRRSNLRIVTHAQNMQNTTARPGSTSALRGVSWHAPSGRWQAAVRLDYVQQHLGYFQSEQEAGAAAAAFRLAHMPFSEERERAC